MIESQDLMRQIASAGARMDPVLSDRDVERLVAGGLRRRRRRRAVSIPLAAAMAGGFALLLTIAFRRGPVVQPEVAKAPPSQSQSTERVLRLSDGSTAMALDAATEIAIDHDSDHSAAFSLSRGRGRFDIKHRPTRTLVVQAGDVTITVLGTLFTVERVADRVGISVERGTVRVDWAVGSALLPQGASGWYPPLVMSATGSATSREQRIHPPAARPTRPAPAQDSSRESAPVPVDTARASVETKPVPVETKPVPVETRPVPVEEAEETAEALLAAADNARLAGRPFEAAEILRGVLRNHRHDARAPLAAFTLGRMLLIEMGQPLEAAAVFAEARRLSPHGPLAEDALAREVEALARASAPGLAKARAQEYLRAYPDGRRAAYVRTIIGTK